MVRAILDGRKTQTRRIISPQNSVFGSVNTRRFWEHADFAAPHPGTLVDGKGNSDWYLHVPCHCQDGTHFTLSKEVDCDYCREYGWQGTRHRLYPKMETGMSLWVRETWTPIPNMKPAGYFSDPKWINRVAWYAADNDRPTWGGKWKPSIHMPRSVSRITLEITEIRVERLQEITAADCRAEGVIQDRGDGETWYEGKEQDIFARVWEQINGPGSWDANPWVWAVEFRHA